MRDFQEKYKMIEFLAAFFTILVKEVEEIESTNGNVFFSEIRQLYVFILFVLFLYVKNGF
jgi:hypothetical protein